MTQKRLGVLCVVLMVGGASCVLWRGFKTEQNPQVSVTAASPIPEPPTIVPSTPTQEEAQAEARDAAEPWRPLTREELNTQLEDLFGGPGSGEPKTPWTPTELTDEATQFKLAELMYRLSFAPSDGVDLRNLEEYGLVLNEDGTVTYDRDQNPKWSDVSKVMAFFDTKDGLPRWLDKLRKNGFSEDELRGIEKRALQKSLPKTRAGVIQALQRFADEVQGPLPLETQRRLAYEMDYQFNMSSVKPKIQWAIGVLAPLDPAKKETLINLVRESQSIANSVMSPRDRNAAADLAIQAAKSGELQKQLAEFQATSPSEEKP